MNFVYFLLGNSYPIHMQVAFSIRTILANALPEDHIYIVTDTPAMFANLPQTTTLPVSEEEIEQWKGPHHFFWRTKIMALKKVAALNPQPSSLSSHMVYLDGDTVLTGNLPALRQLLTEGKGLMHRDEGCPGNMPGKSGEMWAKAHDNTYGGVKIVWEHHMWNAGIVAIPGDLVLPVLDKALAVCDGMLDDDVEPITVEQYSLSIALHELSKGMLTAEPWFIHYWHYKRYWCTYISEFFIHSYYVQRNLDKELEDIRNTNFHSVNMRLKLHRTLRKISGLKY